MTFKEAMTADLDSVFLDTDEYATVAVYEGSDIKVQFVNSYDSASEAFYKMIWCKVSDVPGISKTSTLEVDGVAYGVVDFSKDEYGDGISIYLNEELS